MANVNGTEINLEPTAAMRAEAERYRAWKEEGRRGAQRLAVHVDVNNARERCSVIGFSDPCGAPTRHSTGAERAESVQG